MLSLPVVALTSCILPPPPGPLETARLPLNSLAVQQASGLHVEVDWVVAHLLQEGSSATCAFPLA